MSPFVIFTPDKRGDVCVPDFSVDYIVRIYRFKENNSRSLVGVVEEVGVKGKKAFTNYDELWEILNFQKTLKPGEEQDAQKLKKKGDIYERII